MSGVGSIIDARSCATSFERPRSHGRLRMTDNYRPDLAEIDARAERAST